MVAWFPFKFRKRNWDTSSSFSHLTLESPRKYEPERLHSTVDHVLHQHPRAVSTGRSSDPTAPSGLSRGGDRRQSPITDDAISAAIAECSARLACCGPNGITHHELIDAEKRKFAITLEAVAAQYFGGRHPVAMRAVPDVHGVDGQQQRPSNGVELANNTRLQHIEESIQSLRTDMIGIQNWQRRCLNRKIHERTSGEDRGKVHIYPLLKAPAQEGRGIAGFPSVYPPVHASVVQVGGEFPSPPFPRTLAEIDDLSMAQIQQLAVMMDDDFGIVVGDSMGNCRAKVLWNITNDLR